MKHKKIFRFHSIRHRIMLIFVGLMAAMLLAIWGVNTWWLEGYYVDQKLKVMEQAYTDIDSAIQEKVGENENIGDVLREELEQVRRVRATQRQLRQKNETPVVAIVGGVLPEVEDLCDDPALGLTAVFSINRQAMDFAQSRYASRENYTYTLNSILRLLRAAETK